MNRETAIAWPPPLPGPVSPREVHVRRVERADDPDWKSCLALTAREPDHPDLPAVAGAFDPLSPGRRTVLLAKRVSAGAPEAGVVVRTRADVAARTLHVSVALIHPGAAEDDPDLGGLLAGEAARLARAEMRRWDGRIAPGSGIMVAVSPGPDPSRTGVPALAVADALDSQDEPQPHGLRAVVDLRDGDGRPARLPEPARAVAPPGRDEAWGLFLREMDELLVSSAPRVLASMPEGVVEILDEEGMAAVASESWLRSSPEAAETLAEILDCAGLGRDAVLSVAWDHQAVLSAHAVDDATWGLDFEAVLVEVGPKPRAERRRDVRRFWAAFPYELASVMAARDEASAPPPHPGSPTAH